MYFQEYDEQAYKREMRLLQRRIKYAKAHGHNIDENEIQKYIEREDPENVISFIHSLRRQELLEYSMGATSDYDYLSDTNDEDFVTPEPTISPDVYNIIEQMRAVLLEAPPVVVIQIDVGVLGTVGKREWYDTEEMNNKVYEIFEKNVQEAIQLGSLEALTAYYEEEVQERLAEIMQNWTFNDYLAESEVLSEFTEMLRLLNVGEALSANEMEQFSAIYSDTDNMKIY